VNRQEKHLEEERRERHWDPRRYWLAICETLTWAEAQATVARNTKGECLAKQEILNAATAAANYGPVDDTTCVNALIPARASFSTRRQ
jgi:hypothetical protein